MAPRVSALELAAFRSVNNLPATLELPLSAVMQIGSLFAVPVGAALARLAGRPRLAADLLVAGSITWVGAKAVKRVVARGRPGSFVADILLRGRPQRGLGFPSQHAAVAAALSTVASPGLGVAGRGALWALTGAVATARIYVGAHLPIDVVGGAAMGSAIGLAGISVRAGRARA